MGEIVLDIFWAGEVNALSLSGDDFQFIQLVCYNYHFLSNTYVGFTLS
jgi:hypothetical protein